MALTINDMSGGELNGLQELSASSGSPTAPSTNPRTGTFHYRLDANESITFDPFVSVADAGTDYVVGFGVNLSDKTPAVNADFLRISEVTSIILILELQTNGDVLVQDVDNNTIRTINDPFTDGTYHYIEVYFQHADSATVEVFIDNVSQGSDSAKDLNATEAIDKVIFINQGSTGITVDIDDYYFESGATAATDRLSTSSAGVEVLGVYQNTVEDATDQGDALANGTWALVGEVPLNEGASNDAQYVDTGNLTGSTICDSADSNARPGPSGDANVDGDSNIKAAKWIGRFKRGTGGGRTHNFYGGNDGAGANHATWIASNDAKTLGMALTTGFVTFTMISESTEVPSSTEDFQYGFSKDTTAGQDIFCGDIWAMLLHVPTVSAPVYPDELLVRQFDPTQLRM